MTSVLPRVHTIGGGRRDGAADDRLHWVADSGSRVHMFGEAHMTNCEHHAMADLGNPMRLNTGSGRVTATESLQAKLRSSTQHPLVGAPGAAGFFQLTGEPGGRQLRYRRMGDRTSWSSRTSCQRFPSEAPARHRQGGDPNRRSNKSKITGGGAPDSVHELPSAAAESEVVLPEDHELSHFPQLSACPLCQRAEAQDPPPAGGSQSCWRILRRQASCDPGEFWFQYHRWPCHCGVRE